ncbi:MAG: enoyl-CoA hydratase/isomerase family protein, partial [Chloroflexota bacterium]
ASETARFSFAQMRNALTTGWGGAGRLVNQLGQSRAIELLLTARIFSVEEAERIGFVHRVVPTSQEVLPAAQAWAAELVALPCRALAAMKELVLARGERPLSQTYALEKELFTSLWGQPDHLEALQAFGEKRKPKFNR